MHQAPAAMTYNQELTDLFNKTYSLQFINMSENFNYEIQFLHHLQYLESVCANSVEL